MVTFDTLLSFFSYNLFVIILSFLLYKSIERIVEDINDKKIKNGKKDQLKIGGVYGRRRLDGDDNNPFSPICEYEYYVTILDIKPSRDGHCEYCQYVFLNDNMSPYSSYSDTMIYSSQTTRFDNWEYIKDIDLNTIKIS